MTATAAAAPCFVDVVLPVPLDQAFTYAAPPGVQIGVRVLAPWGSRRLCGVVTAVHAAPPPTVEAARIKPLAGVVDLEPVLDAALLQLVGWAAGYYQAPVGEVMRCALPPAGAAPPLRRFYRLLEPLPPPRGAGQRQVLAELQAAGGEAEAGWLRSRVSASALAALVRRGQVGRRESAAPPEPPAWPARPRVAELNPAQQRALDAIQVQAAPGAPGPPPLLLYGVTGSGKTAVYLAAIASTLARGESALLLVPEIGLTPALFADVTDAFPGRVAVLHSGLGDGERAAHWDRLRTGAAAVAIGTRSAVFAPLVRLGLIVVDEEHDASFKQQESPRYHGRDVAIMRGKLSGARVVLGSATPSLETYTHARSGKYRLAEMLERVERRPLPRVEVVDMGAEFRAAAAAARPQAPLPPPLFSAALRQALEARLALGQQAMVLINRRGFAPLMLCRSCGASVMCRDCALALTLHKRAQRLVCHFCGYQSEVPSACPACGSEHLHAMGSGSEKIEEVLAQLLPTARIARLDRDTARTRRHFERTLARFRAGEFDILIGTQMIAKGHDLAGVTLVGVLQADLGLNFPDFRAAERTFQLLTQVAGRAGRGEQPGQVLVQALHPEHYAVRAAAAGDFAAFYEQESGFRRWLHYPPFAALASVQLRHRDHDRALALAAAAGAFVRQRADSGTRVLGPAPALLARAKAEYRFQFLFKSSSRRALAVLLRSLREFARAEKFPTTALVVDVDPLVL